MLKKKILIVDDNVNLLESLKLFFMEKAYTVYSGTTAAEGLKILRKINPEIAIIDIKLPDMDGLELIKTAKDFNINTKFITITAFQDMETTVKAIKLGTIDYVRKPVDIEELNSIVEKALTNIIDYNYLTIKEQYYKKDTIIGKSKSMQEIFKIIALLSEVKTNVLITGESGTGKELIAKAIHYYSQNPHSPFIAINCSAIVENLWESELFGHEKGSFTGANSRKIGKFEAAGSGTVFLDEIGEIPLNIQPKLLRVLQEREYEKVGGIEKISMNARIIAATNRDLKKNIEKERFRKDLYYRLKVFEIEVPPLRDRIEDITLLVDYLVKKINANIGKKISRVPLSVIKMFKQYHWPGNVRELENVLTRAMILSKGNAIDEKCVSNLLNISNKKSSTVCELELQSLRLIEKEHIEKVLKATDFNISKTAKILEISRPTLRKKIKEWKISFHD